MKTHAGSIGRALGACAIFFMTASCGGSQTPTSPALSNQSRAAATAGRLGGEASWMASDAKTTDLLYVSNYRDGSIYVYSYPDGAPKGQLLNVGAGTLCSDQKGDVFVSEGNEIREYAHGALRSAAALRNPLGGDLQLCAVDPSTGNLAAASSVHAQSGVAIYANGKGSPKIYRAEGLAGYSSGTYDDEGDLFVAGPAADRDAAAKLAELPKGAEQFRAIAWNGVRPSRLGSIQWDGKYLAVESPGSDSGPATLFRYAVNAGRATLVEATPLKGAGTPTRFWIHGGRVVVANSAGVTFYAYPAGGSPTNVIKDARGPRSLTVSPASQSPVAVVTYHYDNLRTGWNDNESALTYGSLQSGSFGLLESVSLDDQVDAQPLVVPNQTTTRGNDPGQHDVVYVATESNTVYAIDASDGTVLFSQNLGQPVPTPLGCTNNGPNVGITGTPVIDLSANVMYVIAYTLTASIPTYTIHELDLSNLEDAVTPVVVSASHTLTNGDTYDFNATYQRQRPGLLEANGNVYAGFGSFCDFSASQSRGWLLGWQAGTLTPLAANRLNDALGSSPDDFFLSSVWMSGYGVAADSSGNVYFVTGNSDPKTYNGVTNVQESVVKVSSDLTQLLGVFTPKDVNSLDRGDVDFGSGGVLLLPQTPSGHSLAAAAGKEGTMFLLDQKNLGGFSRHRNNVVDAKSIGGCWCGESYFDAASDSTPRIVASGGTSVTVWKVGGAHKPKLISAGSVNGLPDGQDPGFFTSVSSNGNGPGAIIWAVTRPNYVPGSISLFAFGSQPQSGSSTLQTLFQGTAGYWASAGGNANLVPVVANGRVYVASYEQLDIFGLASSGTKKPAVPEHLALRAPGGAAHEVTGTLIAVSGSVLTLRTRTGRIVRSDDSAAVRHERSADLVVGEAFTASGTYDAAGVLHAALIVRAKPSPSSWPPDR